MNSYSAPSARIAFVIAAALAAVSALALMPRTASAAAVSVTSITATSSNVYANTGFATTTRVTSGDEVRYQLTLGGTPLIAPQINILGMGSTTMSGSAAAWFYATTSVTAWTEGAIPFYITVGSTDGGAGTSTQSQANLTGTNVTYDATAPTLSSVSWSDVDGSTQFSGTDTLTLTFSETMATSTLTGSGSAGLDTVLALSNSHTFSTTTAPTWNTAGTVLTITLGAANTIATGDTIDPTTAVKDSVGIADATSAALTITDNVSPLAPGGLSDTTFHGGITVSLTSTGSTDIHYTEDGTTPTCTTGTLYTPSITISDTETLKAVGCDAADNASSVTTAVYTHTGNGGSGGGGGGGGSSHVTAATPASQTPGCQPGDAFNTQTGKSCTTPATPSGSALANASANASFNRNLTVGSSGEDVRALQAWLNTHEYVVAETGPGSRGNESMFFGALTRAAVARYQKANGITPAVGFMGPITRASLNAAINGNAGGNG